MNREELISEYKSGRRNFRRVDLSEQNLSRIDLCGADLSGARLSGANLSGAKLSWANLSWADLSRADLSSADLSDARLSRADLSSADLSSAKLIGAKLICAKLNGADMRGAKLIGADLRSADLSSANLSGARLSGAQNLDPTTAAQLMRCPAEGEFIAYKKCAGGAIIKLLIPADAERSSSTGYKCRASHVIVLEGEGTSCHDPQMRYTPGARIVCHHWGKNRWEECAGGIHFFMTREEAEDYNFN